ncbi:hypothetical protein [Desulfospira joergensenii]|uniref:hypothetical protein n=1 Tax=Desulfospira joergensenii TaxID=53329 RepID=UPI0003B4F471|nr:hypothetical protein [Desulfospira joergensenii]
MEDKPLPNVFFHFRFKFLAVTAIAFLFYIILTGASEIEKFADSPQFKLMGPFFIFSGILFLLFRKVPIKCPHCHKIVSTKKDWTCPNCGKSQGKERILADKCLHCRQVPDIASCTHCKKEFRL